MCLGDLTKELLGTASVGGHSGGIAFSHFDPGGGEFDECFEEVGDGTGSVGGVPQRLPDFVSFPVITVIEKFDAAQILGRGLPVGGINGLGLRDAHAEAVAGGIADGVREMAGNVGVRREIGVV